MLALARPAAYTGERHRFVCFDIVKAGMSKRYPLYFSFSFVLLLAVCLVVGSHQKEPKYQGRSANHWLDDLATGKKTGYPKAIHEIGTNILPYAVHYMQRADKPLRNTYVTLRAKLPKPLQRVCPEPKPVFDVIEGTDVFVMVGPTAIPQIIAFLKHRNPDVRQAAAQALGSLGTKSPFTVQITAALTDALRDENLFVRDHALSALGFIGAEASSAVPAIVRLLTAPVAERYANFEFRLRLRAVHALGEIGPGASSALPVLKGNLNDPMLNREGEDTLVKHWIAGESAVAVWRIDSNVDTALPVLLRELPNNNEYGKCEWLQVLGEMGARSEAAKSHLMRFLNEEQRDWVLECVTNALRAINDEAAVHAGLD